MPSPSHLCVPSVLLLLLLLHAAAPSVSLRLVQRPGRATATRSLVSTHPLYNSTNISTRTNGSAHSTAAGDSNVTAADGPAETHQRATASNASSSVKWEDFVRPGEDFVNLIIVFKHQALTERFSVCGVGRWKRQHKLQQQQSLTAASAASNYSTMVDGTADACSALQGSCRHLFKAAFAGLSGRFNQHQFHALQKCAGQGGIDYIERDGQVTKAEQGDYSNWWRHTAPTGTSLQQLQQQLEQQHEPGAASASAGFQVQAFDHPVASETHQEQQQQQQHTLGSKPSMLIASTHSSADSLPAAAAADGASSSPASQTPDRQQFWQWMIAEVGLAAQRQLSSGVPDVITVSAMDAAGHGDAPGVSTAEGPDAGAVNAEGSPEDQAAFQAAEAGGSGRVTKNQDPGLPVDIEEITNPQIVAEGEASDASSGSPSAQQLLPQQAAEEANQQPGVKKQRLVTALWNLDRVDQRSLPLDGAYTYGTGSTAGTGKGVTIYTLDSGIRSSHQEFQPWDGSGSRASVGPDFVDDDDAASDCDGHGTHVSSTAAGRSVGVAKEASVVGVRVLDCDGAGSISDVVAGLDWVASNALKPAVASLSLGVPSGRWSRSLETAVTNVVAAGIPVVVAAGNSAVDSCKIAPARVPEAITVAGSNLPSKFQQTSEGDTENVYRWSNTGTCIDLFAPGVDIYGACGGPSRCEDVTDQAYTWASGTSMAAPHVTGLVAVYLEQHPNATPAEVHDAMVDSASTGLLNSPLILEGTPNRLLFSRELDQPVVATSGSRRLSSSGGS